MEKKVTILLITALAVMAVLASAIPVAAQADPGISGVADLASMTMPRAVILAISSDGVTEGNVTFNVPHSAKVFRVADVDYGIVSTTNTPVKGSINTAEGMGVLSTTDVLPAYSTTDYLSRSVIPVNGTNAVIALKSLNMTGASDGEYSFEFGELSVYLPDGTMNTFTLNKPIKMTYSMDRTRFTMEADPAVASTIAGTLASGVTFPEDAKPVKLSKILGQETLA